MGRTFRFAWVLGLAALLFLPARAAAQGCNERCLLEMGGAYMDAMTANDPASIPVAPNLLATENAVATPLTAGVWKSATHWTYRHTFVDPVQGAIGVFGSIREGDTPAMVALRLKVVNRRFTESEILVARRGSFSLFEPTWASEPKPLFKTIVPADRRMSRAELAKIPVKYFDALMQGKPELFPVHPDAVRVENGFQTTSGLARPSASISEGLYRLVYMSRVRDLRTPVIDVERGLVLVALAVDLPKMDKTIMVRGKPHQVTSERHRLPRTLHIYELFKVEGGLVTGIEAVLRDAPLGADIGWRGAAP